MKIAIRADTSFRILSSLGLNADEYWFVRLNGVSIDVISLSPHALPV